MTEENHGLEQAKAQFGEQMGDPTADNKAGFHTLTYTMEVFWHEDGEYGKPGWYWQNSYNWKMPDYPCGPFNTSNAAYAAGMKGS